MAKHVGIVACSAEGAALCYRTLCSQAPALMDEHMHPEVSMHTHPLAEYMVHIRVGDWAEVAKLMLSSARKLAEIGAGFAIRARPTHPGRVEGPSGTRTEPDPQPAPPEGLQGKYPHRSGRPGGKRVRASQSPPPERA